MFRDLRQNNSKLLLQADFVECLPIICSYILLQTAQKNFIFKVIPQYCIAHPYCAHLRTISASLARANKRVHVHNERNFPQAKLDSEINARFLLNEHGDLYFLLHNNSVHIGLLNLKEN